MTAATIRREFLGWDRPALPEAVRRLAERYRDDGTLDLSSVIIVVPAQRAGRRFRELLAFRAEDDNLRLTPPEIITDDKLPELLYSPQFAAASEIVQDLAWAQALRDLPAETRRRCLPHPPSDTETVRWLEFAKLLRGLHAELAAAGLDFAAVTRTAAALAGRDEGERWTALAAVQRRYHQLLDGRQLRDQPTARLEALAAGAIRTDHDIILLATADLDGALKRMLDQVAERVTAYIAAPEELADRFDPYGCLIPEKWREAPLTVRDEQLRQVDGPLDQAAAVSEWLGEVAGRFRKDEVAVGVPDVSLVPQLQRELEQFGVQARWVKGRSLGETEPYRLLAAAARFASRRRYEDLAELLRHPDLEAWLRPRLPRPKRTDAQPASLPARLDEYYNRHLPGRFHAGAQLPHASEWPDLAAALGEIGRWLKEASASHPLREWGSVIRGLLDAVYGDRTVTRDETLYATCSKILAACDVIESVPASLDAEPLSAADAFRVALGPLAQDTLPPPADPEAVELLGWLELPLDDAPALIVTSFNEGAVPIATPADAFLPDQLRRELGLPHSERRYARDAYATEVLCHCRADLRLVFARRDTNDDPVQPSRLLFACPDEMMVGRARRFFADRSPAAPRRLLLAPDGAIPDQSAFRVPPAVADGEPLLRIPVTHFKQYLACPYRYYLRHRRKLSAVDDAARELDGGAFGTLLHRALGAFGREPDGPRHSPRARDIHDFLVAQLDSMAEGRYGADQRRPAIRLQLEQARGRLWAFAERQADLVREGWRLLYAENSDDDELESPFPVGGAPVLLVGRIDRIDLHETSRAIRILDYKTADTAVTPERSHRRGGEWIDLQLPLYRHLWRTLRLKAPASCSVELGYFNLPKKSSTKDVAIAKWGEADCDAADATARKVIEDLRNGVFGEPVQPAPAFCEDLAAICLDNVFGGPALVEDEETE